MVSPQLLQTEALSVVVQVPAIPPYKVVKSASAKQIKGDYREEFRILRPDGSLRWIRDIAFPVKDEDGNIFKFPKITLYPNGAVQVHTATGTDTVIDLYWGIGNAVWSSGENARLFDAQGNLRAVYRVP